MTSVDLALAAEWARTAVHRAGWVLLSTPGGVSVWTPLHAVDPTGALALVVPAADPLVAAVRARASGPRRSLPGPAAVAEAREESPLPLPCPTRARARLEGRLRELSAAEARSAALEIAVRRPADELLDIGAGHTVLQFQVDRVELVQGEPDRSREAPLPVSAHAWAAADPDPLADEEAMQLAHLVHAHQDALAMLRWLLDPELRHRAGRLAPARLSRHGLELWALTPDGWERAWLPFPAPLAGGDELATAFQSLLRRARLCCGARPLPWCEADRHPPKG
jgi:hypothetical protein